MIKQTQLLNRSKEAIKDEKKRNRRLQTKRFISASAILFDAEKEAKQRRQFWKNSEKFSGQLAQKTKEELDYHYSKESLVLVIRICGHKIPVEIKQAFNQLRLNEMYEGRFIRLNAQTEKLCKMLQEFIVMGNVTETQIEHLIRTRGILWDSKSNSKITITGNLLVEQQLGEHDILTVEDIVEVLHKKLPSIDILLNSLGSFDLKPPNALYLEKFRPKFTKLRKINSQGFIKYMESILSDKCQAYKYI